MTKKRKNTATTASHDAHDHRADELAFDLMSEARDITFDVVERNNSVITLHAHVNSADYNGDDEEEVDWDTLEPVCECCPNSPEFPCDCTYCDGTDSCDCDYCECNRE